MVTLQWGVIKCCRVVSTGSCLEGLGGVIQVGFQWILFSFTFVLHILYFPHHLKYVEVLHEASISDPHPTRRKETTSDWRLAVTLGWVVAAHFLFSLFVTLSVVSDFPLDTTPNRTVYLWATFLGVTSAALSAIQYIPQILLTYRLKLVGALSIPMMCIQTPGAAFMVLSIAIRPGTNWTSWATFATAGLLQGTLLIMCLCWRVRQQRLGIDDFGKPLEDRSSLVTPIPFRPDEATETASTEPTETAPLLGGENGRPQATRGATSFWRRLLGYSD
jgi:hypothetical protein